jgi:hypothetical protein
VSAPTTRRTLLAALGGLAVAGAAGGAVWLSRPAPARAAGTVYTSPTCGCCSAWAEHMAAAGLTLEVVHPDDLAAVKQRHGVPYGMGSCHTAVIDGYVIEGHVPAQTVQRLLRARPEVRGLAVPGMPIGSPGMEGPNAQPYTVYALTRDGGSTPFARIRP